MANYNPRLTVEWELRLCDVDGQPAYFHTWEHKPNGVLGIVEFSDGVERVQPDHIKFFDEQHSNLCEWEKVWKEVLKNEGRPSESDAEMMSDSGLE